MSNWHLLVVDIQQSFSRHITGWEDMLPRCETMIKAAHELGIPVTATEQYPEKLGTTVPEIKRLLSNTPVFEKVAFSSLAHPEAKKLICASLPVKLLLLGIETHVCVLQTALDALSEVQGKITPYVLVDAVGSRRTIDRDTALSRLQREGAVLSTVESAIFEILGKAGTPAFKRILPLVK